MIDLKTVIVRNLRIEVPLTVADAGAVTHGNSTKPQLIHPTIPTYHLHTLLLRQPPILLEPFLNSCRNDGLGWRILGFIP